MQKNSLNMSKLIQRCSIAILIQAVFVIAFQIVIDAILKIVYVTNYLTVINGLLSLSAGFLAFYYGNTTELKIICIHVIVLVLIMLLYVGFAVSSCMLVLAPQDLKKRVRILVQAIFEASRGRSESAQRRMDAIQTRLNCCGVNGIVDYGIYYPQSCCAPPGLNCNLTNDNVYTRGCAHEAYFIIYNAEIIYTVIMIVFTVAPLVATICKAKELRETAELLRYDKRNDRVLVADGGQVGNRNRDRGDVTEHIPMETIDLEA